MVTTNPFSSRYQETSSQYPSNYVSPLSTYPLSSHSQLGYSSLSRLSSLTEEKKESPWFESFFLFRIPRDFWNWFTGLFEDRPVKYESPQSKAITDLTQQLKHVQKKYKKSKQHFKENEALKKQVSDETKKYNAAVRLREKTHRSLEKMRKRITELESEHRSVEKEKTTLSIERKILETEQADLKEEQKKSAQLKQKLNLHVIAEDLEDVNPLEDDIELLDEWMRADDEDNSGVSIIESSKELLPSLDLDSMGMKTKDTSSVDVLSSPSREKSPKNPKLSNSGTRRKLFEGEDNEVKIAISKPDDREDKTLDKSLKIPKDKLDEQLMKENANTKTYLKVKEKELQQKAQALMEKDKKLAEEMEDLVERKNKLKENEELVKYVLQELQTRIDSVKELVEKELKEQQERNEEMAKIQNEKVVEAEATIERLNAARLGFEVAKMEIFEKLGNLIKAFEQVNTRLQNKEKLTTELEIKIKEIEKSIPELKEAHKKSLEEVNNEKNLFLNEFTEVSRKERELREKVRTLEKEKENLNKEFEKMKDRLKKAEEKEGTIGHHITQLGAVTKKLKEVGSPTKTKAPNWIEGRDPDLLKNFYQPDLEVEKSKKEQKSDSKQGIEDSDDFIMVEMADSPSSSQGPENKELDSESQVNIIFDDPLTASDSFSSQDLEEKKEK
jgi:chromosome segregation ATPase